MELYITMTEQAATWLNVINVLLRERIKMWENIYNMIPFIQKSKTGRNQEYICISSNTRGKLRVEESQGEGPSGPSVIPCLLYSSYNAHIMCLAGHCVSQNKRCNLDSSSTSEYGTMLSPYSTPSWFNWRPIADDWWLTTLRQSWLWNINNLESTIFPVEFSGLVTKPVYHILNQTAYNLDGKWQTN